VFWIFRIYIIFGIRGFGVKYVHFWSKNEVNCFIPNIPYFFEKFWIFDYDAIFRIYGIHTEKKIFHLLQGLNSWYDKKHFLVEGGHKIALISLRYNVQFYMLTSWVTSMKRAFPTRPGILLFESTFSNCLGWCKYRNELILRLNFISMMTSFFNHSGTSNEKHLPNVRVYWVFKSSFKRGKLFCRNRAENIFSETILFSKLQW